jgi:hypothetical protein
VLHPSERALVEDRSRAGAAVLGGMHCFFGNPLEREAAKACLR